MTIQEILNSNDSGLIRALFSFNAKDTDKAVLFKFGLWARYFFPKYFLIKDVPVKDADFHSEIDKGNLAVYRGKLKSFLDIVFRGGGKTARTKLFIAFAILNDFDHSRKYFKVLTKDMANAKQIVTDVYNMFVDVGVARLYPETFAKTDSKREETMTSFTTATGIKVTADTVGVEQRGAIQESARPDFCLFDDIETRKSLSSAVDTLKIWDNVNEATTGLSSGGGFVICANYISERGNVHRLIQKQNEDNKVLIVPMKKKDGSPMWPERDTAEDIAKRERDWDDFEGEGMCRPSASLDVLFDRGTLDTMPIRQPIKEVAGLKMFRDFDPSHRYASGHDIAGGVGLDSSTSVFIDFSTVPAQVVATYASNEIRPDVFGDEIARQGEKFGECLVAPENNKYDMAILRLRQIYPTDRIFKMVKESAKIKDGKITDYGWSTNALTKPKALYALAKALEDGLLVLNDERLIAEAKSYSRDDLMDSTTVDPRMTTRHFDLLMAASIAWAMKDFAEYPKKRQEEETRVEINRSTRVNSRTDYGL